MKTVRQMRSWLLFGGVVVVWAASYFGVAEYARWNFPTAGQVGDTFGAVNALFSGLAFAGVLYILYDEKEERADSTKREITLRCYDRLVETEHVVDRFAGAHYKVPGADYLDGLQLMTLLDMIEALRKAKELHLTLAEQLIGEKLYVWQRDLEPEIDIEAKFVIIDDQLRQSVRDRLQKLVHALGYKPPAKRAA
jgi:hypothetical protein